MDCCPFCGTRTSPPAQFCQQCGRSLAGIEAAAVGDLDVAVLDRLRGERARLSRELTSLRAISVERALTSSERRSWDHLLSAWKDITAELTAMLDAVAPRQEHDRRGEERRQLERREDDGGVEGQERRSGMQRRMRQRRRGRDRRKPFTDDQP
jgi:hypothetical protein